MLFGLRDEFRRMSNYVIGVVSENITSVGVIGDATGRSRFESVHFNMVSGVCR